MAALLKNWSADLVLCTNGKADLTADQRTLLENHKGVYAAGDITSPMQGIAVAVFQGSVAAGGLNHFLIMEDFV
ncbi:hypothetical protein, partial [Nostoc sp. FACHB-888]|uniref:hypothetical protein n=1 Tax=Nostoc sp. FACHB-888 TaxID=2692842 RepID=UPI0018EFCA7F